MKKILIALLCTACIVETKEDIKQRLLAIDKTRATDQGYRCKVVPLITVSHTDVYDIRLQDRLAYVNILEKYLANSKQIMHNIIETCKVLGIHNQEINTITDTIFNINETRIKLINNDHLQYRSYKKLDNGNLEIEFDYDTAHLLGLYTVQLKHISDNIYTLGTPSDKTPILTMKLIRDSNSEKITFSDSDILLQNTDANGTTQQFLLGINVILPSVKDGFNKKTIDKMPKNTNIILHKKDG